MRNKLSFVLLALAFLGIFARAEASVSINEIMYDLEGTDTGREWIEVYNDSAEAVDFSTYKLFEANTNHALVPVGDKNIQGGGYAVIASDAEKFKADNPSFSGLLFDSSFSLSNEGETLAIKDADLATTSEYSYTNSLGANGDGKTIQKVSGAWTVGTASPAAQNTSANQDTSSSNQSDSSSGGATSTSSSASTTTAKKRSSIGLEIIGKTLTFTGTPTEFSASVIGYYGEVLTHGKLAWNFGDGEYQEVNLPSENKVMHTFRYTGEYLVSLEYFENSYTNTPLAVDEVLVKVVPATVVISSVGNEADFYVELQNTSKYDIDLAGWVLSENQKIFTFPKRSILRSGQKLMVAPETTGLAYADKGALRLISSAGYVVYEYSTGSSPVVAAASGIKIKHTPIAVSSKFIEPSSSTQKVNINNVAFESSPSAGGVYKIGESQIEKNYSKNLAANALSSIGEDRQYIFFFGLFVLIVLGVSSVYFVRSRKEEDTAPGADYKIVNDNKSLQKNYLVK